MELLIYLVCSLGLVREVKYLLNTWFKNLVLYILRSEMNDWSPSIMSIPLKGIRVVSVRPCIMVPVYIDPLVTLIYIFQYV